MQTVRLVHYVRPTVRPTMSDDRLLLQRQVLCRAVGSFSENQSTITEGRKDLSSVGWKSSNGMDMDGAK